MKNRYIKNIVPERKNKTYRPFQEDADYVIDHVIGEYYTSFGEVTRYALSIFVENYKTQTDDERALDYLRSKKQVEYGEID